MRSVRQMIVVAGVAASLIALPGTAWAGFTAARQTATTVSSASITAPSSLTATKKCAFLGIGGDTMTISWAASTSSAVTGYQLYLDASGTSNDITKAVSGRTSTSATVSVGAGVTYSITVSSVVQNWTATSTALSAGCGLFG